MKHVLLGLFLVGITGLAGCSSTGDTAANEEEVKPELLVVEEQGPDDATTSGVSRSGSADSVKFGDSARAAGNDNGQQAYSGHPLDNPNSALMSKVVYFEFDQSTIEEQDKVTLDAHADYLVNNAAAKIRLAGHADERGTREYNVALGERRANAVSRYMTLKGVSRSQISVVSYGEERPAKMGHDDASWALNRRVEITYTQR